MRQIRQIFLRLTANEFWELVVLYDKESKRLRINALEELLGSLIFRATAMK